MTFEVESGIEQSSIERGNEAWCACISPSTPHHLQRPIPFDWYEHRAKAIVQLETKFQSDIWHQSRTDLEKEGSMMACTSDKDAVNYTPTFLLLSSFARILSVLYHISVACTNTELYIVNKYVCIVFFHMFDLSESPKELREVNDCVFYKGIIKLVFFCHQNSI